MRTTIDIPDDLLRAVEDEASRRGMGFEAYAATLLREGLKSRPKGMGRPVPVSVRLRGLEVPPMTNAEIFERLDRQEDLAKGRIVG